MKEEYEYEQLIITDPEINEMDQIFEKICNKYKNESDEYLLKSVLDLKKGDYLFEGRKIDKIQEEIYFVFDYFYCYLEKGKKKIIIKFLVKVNFIDEEKKKKFSFWVCSLDYLKEKLKSMGYKQAKLNKKILFPEKEKKDDKGSSGSSSESLDNMNELDNKLINYEVKVAANIFSLENIFDESQKIFFSNKYENIKEYRKDLNMPKTIIKNKDKFILNNHYSTDLSEIEENKNGVSYYYYNEKSGLTLSLLLILEKNREIFKTRYFYFNSLYIYKYSRKYLYFRIAKMFYKEEKDLFLKLLNPEKEENTNYNSDYISKILNKILKELSDVHIIFDNIRSQDIFYKIMDIINIMNQNTEYIIIKEDSHKKQEAIKIIKVNNLNDIETIDKRPLNNYKVSLFFPINNSTLKIITSPEIYQSNIKSLFPIEYSYKEELTPTEYFNSLFQENYDKELYKSNIKKNLSEFLDDNKKNNSKIDYLIFLIELLNFQSLTKKKSLIYYNEHNYLVKFLPYLYISLNVELGQVFINKIKFRTNFIEEMIYDKINHLLSQNIITDAVFKHIKNKAIEGIYIEKQIIYYLVTKIIDFKKIKIEKIYCFDSVSNEKNLKNINKKERIIFIQNSELAPLYDFGVIMYINEKPIFKGYQIGINKPLCSLLLLTKEKIKMDLLYFISKINNFLNEKITEFSFGIITTKYAYDNQKNNKNNFNNDYELDNINDISDEYKKEEENDTEYKNYNCMKTFCKDNNYEFLIFDPKDNNFYIDNDNDKNLQKIIFDNYYNNEFNNIITNYILKNEENYNLVKLPAFPKENIKAILEYIKKSINESIKEKNLNFIGKFQKKTDIQIDFNNLINENFIIYLKNKDKKNIFYKNNFLCDDCKDSNIFYVFESSLNKLKKKKNDIIKQKNTNLFITQKVDDNNEKNNPYLQKKRLRNNENEACEEKKGKINDEKRDKNDEENDSDDKV